MKTLAEMTEAEREQCRERIRAWERAAPVLERLRREEIRRTDTVSAMEALDECFEHAAKSLPPRTETGLVEQQAFFLRHRRE